MSRPRPRDTALRWWFVALVLALSSAAAVRAIVVRAPPRGPEPPPPRTVHNPDPGRLEAMVRDPFMTGAEWRAKLRERTEGPGPTPVTTGAPVVVAPPPPPPPGSELGFAGTMRSGSTLYAVLNSGMEKVGAQVGRYVIEEISDDQIVIGFDGQRATLRIGGGGVVSTVATPPSVAASPSPATTGTK